MEIIIGLFRKAIGIPLWIVAVPFIAIALVMAFFANELIDIEELEV